LDSDGHRLQAERFEAFLEKIVAAAPDFQEWSGIVRYYAALHYVDAFLSTRTRAIATNTTGFKSSRARPATTARGVPKATCASM